MQGCSSAGPVRLAYCKGNCGDTTSRYAGTRAARAAVFPDGWDRRGKQQLSPRGPWAGRGQQGSRWAEALACLE